MTIRTVLSLDPTATSMEATMNGNFAASFRVMEASPLEYVPASRSPKRSRARNDRCGFGVWLSRCLAAAEKSPLAAGLIDGGTKSAVVKRELGPGKLNNRTSMYGLPWTRENATNSR